MTHQAPAPLLPPRFADPAGEVAQLQHVLVLVGQLGGSTVVTNEAALDTGARIAAAYADALPIIQHRFETLLGEATGWAAAGVEALLASAETASPKAAAAALADELRGALTKLEALLGL
jgi:hypothetical protein